MSLQKNEIFTNEYMSGKFNLVSAGIYNYLPNIDPNDHIKIFNNLLNYQKRSIEEQKDLHIIEKTRIIGLSRVEIHALKHKQNIYCTFHIGSYRIINLFLIKNEIKYTLVISQSLLKQQGDNFLKIVDNFKGCNHSNFDIVDADSDSSTYRIIKKIKEGRSVLFYLDGNLGSGENNNQNSNCSLVNFLSQKIYARTGAAYLSHYLNVPIQPVFSFVSDSNKNCLFFSKVIVPCQTVSREIFAKNCTNDIYDIASKIIRRFPEQWEGWMYLHKSANINREYIEVQKSSISKVKNKSIVEFNNLYFGLIKIEDMYYLFQKLGYKSYIIQEDLYKLLLKNIISGIEAYHYPEKYLLELISKGVIKLKNEENHQN